MSDSRKQPSKAAVMPTDITARIGRFDRFAGWSAGLASRAPFFSFCLLLVLLWLVEGIVKVSSEGSFDAFLQGDYQLQINTTTTIITFLLVALLQNSQSRSDQATQHKLNALADALADLMAHTADRAEDPELAHDIVELRAAVGLEEREDTSPTEQ